MMKFIVSALFLICASAQAVELKVLDSEIPGLRWSKRLHVSTSFYVDQVTNEGFAKVVVTKERFHVGPNGCVNSVCAPGPIDYGPQYELVYSDLVKVEGLTLVDKKLVFQGEGETVECATFGLSRVLKRPTLYLSGKCDLEGYLARGRVEADAINLVVKFSTK